MKIKVSITFDNCVSFTQIDNYIKNQLSTNDNHNVLHFTLEKMEVVDK